MAKDNENGVSDALKTVAAGAAVGGAVDVALCALDFFCTGGLFTALGLIAGGAIAVMEADKKSDRAK